MAYHLVTLTLWSITDPLSTWWLGVGWAMNGWNSDAEGVQEHFRGSRRVWTVILWVRSCEETYQAKHLQFVHFVIFMLYFHNIYSKIKNRLLDNDSIDICYDSREKQTKEHEPATSRLLTALPHPIWQVSTNMGQALLQPSPWIHGLRSGKQESSLHGSSYG